MFFGLGSDGTVGANKNSVKIIVEQTGAFVQGYFVYDSKKSGAMTVSHLRFGPGRSARHTWSTRPTSWPATSSSCSTGSTCSTWPKPGATFLLNTHLRAGEVWGQLPRERAAPLQDKKLELWVIDARPRSPTRPAWATASTRSCRRASSPCPECCLPTRPSPRSRPPSTKTYGKRGHADRASAISPPSTAPWPAWPGWRSAARDLGAPGPIGTSRSPPVGTGLRAQGHPGHHGGQGRPPARSALPADGRFPSGTTRFEKRALPPRSPCGIPHICIDCGKCVIVCPHAAIRMKVFAPEALAGAPDGFLSKPFRSKDLTGHLLTSRSTRTTAPVAALRGRVPRQVQDRGQAQVDQHGAGATAPRAERAQLGLLRVHPRAGPVLAAPRLGQGRPGPPAAVRVLRSLLGLRRDPLPEAGQPALRRPHAGRQRHRVLVHLRRQPADDARGPTTPRAGAGLGQLPVRGQRRVRPGHPRWASRPRSARARPCCARWPGPSGRAWPPRSWRPTRRPDEEAIVRPARAGGRARRATAPVGRGPDDVAAACPPPASP